MNDSGATLETETPVNPYTLLEAVNRSSDSVNAAWLIFLGLMAYLLITVAGITHKDLLLNSDIVLPILQVKIDLTRFFLFAPILLVLLHMGVMSQLVLLAGKTLEFAAAIRMLESSDQRSHPLRLELDNFFFVQAIAGPERSRIMGFFLHAMSWLTLVLTPVVLLLYVQLVFLPYHDVAITWVHRLALIADIAMLVFIGVFVLRSETSFFRAFLGTSLRHPLSLLATAIALGLVACFSLLFATIPGEAMDRVGAERTGGRQVAGSDARHLFGYVLPTLAAPDQAAFFGLFHRNLSVIDADLVVDKDVTPGEPSISLRNRDLRFARLDRTDLHQADMTGANLEGASLIGADLRNAWLQCADLNELLLTEDRRAARCTNARGANFSRARLTQAKMAGINLRGAKLDEAQLEGAVLAHSLMPEVSFASARMERADLSDGMLVGANFLLATLQGADLSGAKLQLADLANVGLQGANLRLADLQAAVLRDAELEGANMQLAKLQGASMSGAKVQGTDMTGAVVWRTTPPGGDNVSVSDMTQLVMRPPADDELVALQVMLDGLEGGPLKSRMAEALGPLLDAKEKDRWGSPVEQQQWQALIASATSGADTYKGRLTDYLAKLMCRPRWSNGAVAAGIARRAMGHGFKGDMPALYEKLKAADCPASTAMSAPLMRELAAAADAARAQ
jgi:uncharacterized protein YjbI with pentapeptide repeats